MDDKVIRIDPGLHREIKARAALEGRSLKEWVEMVLREELLWKADETEVAAAELSAEE